MVPLASIVNAPEVTSNAFVPADISCVDASKTASISFTAATRFACVDVVRSVSVPIAVLLGPAP